MTQENINQTLMYLRPFVKDESLMFIKNKLEDADERFLDMLYLKKLHNPTTILLFSIFLGGFGVDRFMIGDTGIGVAKLLLGWATCGIWPLIDIFISYNKAKEKNFQSIMLDI